MATDRTTNAASQFPDSPPDSSSEPYSPPNDNRNHSEVSTTNSTVATVSNMATVISLGTYINPHSLPHAHQQQLHPQQAHAQSHLHGHCGTGQSLLVMSPQQLAQQQHQVTLHPSAGGVAFNMSKTPYNPYGLTELGKLSHPSQATTPLLNLAQQGTGQFGSIGNIASHPPKKRKYSDSPPGTLTTAGLMTTLHINNILPIKPEPCPPDLHYGLHHDGGSEDESYGYDFPVESGMFLDGSYQVIKWTPHQPNRWCTLLDDTAKDIPPISYRVDADKGFNFAPSDDAFVCQKKNHFQITVHITMAATPKFVKLTEGGTAPIDGLYMHFYGIKMESPSQTIKIEQSQSDRSKKQFHAVRLDIIPDQLNKMTVGRLHFSETTTNNMRKKGKPNPDQRYFQLVVALQAHCGSDIHMIAAHASERIIVRASNPGQFESDVEVIWNKGKTADSIYHAGRVGINTDSPDEALTIHGNLKVSGHIVSPSDIRAKKNFEELDTREQLQNISKLKVYKYSFKEEFAEYAGLPDDDRVETGVLAQDVCQILPDAVCDTGDVILPNGQRIDNFLVVNKDRIFIENVGAVKELCKVTDKLENRITEIEYISTKLSKLGKKHGSFISGSSVSASISSGISRTESRSSASSALSPKTVSSSQTRRTPRHRHVSREADCHQSDSQPTDAWFCSNRGIQITVIVLVVVMFICLMSMTTLYLIDRKSSLSNEASALQAQNGPSYANQTTTVSIPYPLVPPHCLMKPQDCPIICTCRPASTTQLPTPPDDPNHPFGSTPTTFVSNLSPRILSTTTTMSPNDVRYNQTDMDWSVPPEDKKNDTPKKNQTRKQNGTKQIIRNNSVVIQHDQATGQRIVIISGRQKRDTGLKKQVARVFFTQMNDTVSRLYCANPGCMSDSGGLYSYLIPISPMFPRLPITLKFALIGESPSLAIKLCNQSQQLPCSTDLNNYDLTNLQTSVMEWDLPAGIYIKSSYKFRISSALVDVCSRPDTEVGVTFAEYNFSFYRVCAY